MQGLSNKYLDLQITATKSRSSSFCWNPYEASLNGCSLHSGELGFLLAGILGTRVPSSGDPEAGVLPGAGLRSSNPAIPGGTGVGAGPNSGANGEILDRVRDLPRFCLSYLPSYFLLFNHRHLELSFLIAATRRIGTIGIMSKRSSSSVPTTADRARLKRKMESPVSRSDSSSKAGEGSDCDLMAPLPLSCVYAVPPLVGPASSVGEDELVEWWSRYSLPCSIVLRISPSQLNPPACRIFIAIENLGDLQYLSLGINEVIFAYHLAPLNGGEGRFHLSPRSGLPIVEVLPKRHQKGPVFNKKWQERYAFMAFPGSSHRWNFIAITHPSPSEGEKAVLRARQLPGDHGTRRSFL
ncbi:hypothetical protein F2Q68_00035281 [Brassica cretica]|uniref:Uncharacterized protein n=1 Tax=Brassica cretica TaxID=69181 RepID=A0A8S9GUR0_BRACR|nr:hypothetical protein F2Q68_00035281 [Brassica cretica]